MMARERERVGMGQESCKLVELQSLSAAADVDSYAHASSKSKSSIKIDTKPPPWNRPCMSFHIPSLLINFVFPISKPHDTRIAVHVRRVASGVSLTSPRSPHLTAIASSISKSLNGDCAVFGRLRIIARRFSIIDLQHRLDILPLRSSKTATMSVGCSEHY